MRRDADVIRLRVTVPWQERQSLETRDLTGVGDMLGEPPKKHTPAARRTGVDVVDFETTRSLPLTAASFLPAAVWNTTLRPSTA